MHDPRWHARSRRGDWVVIDGVGNPAFTSFTQGWVWTIAHIDPNDDSIMGNCRQVESPNILIAHASQLCEGAAGAVEKLKSGQNDAHAAGTGIKHHGQMLTVTEELLDDGPRSSQFILRTHMSTKPVAQYHRSCAACVEGHMAQRDL